MQPILARTRPTIGLSAPNRPLMARDLASIVSACIARRQPLHSHVGGCPLSLAPRSDTSHGRSIVGSVIVATRRPQCDVVSVLCGRSSAGGAVHSCRRFYAMLKLPLRAVVAALRSGLSRARWRWLWCLRRGAGWGTKAHDSRLDHAWVRWRFCSPGEGSGMGLPLPGVLLGCALRAAGGGS